ncbi:MAG: DUF5666 domain-containing protein [Rubrivivax sp.]|nr:DUF5666 domain-containing protein [Rubrivivax sp.]
MKLPALILRTIRASLTFALPLSVVASVFVACGGGVETGGTGSFASGTITGFGSVIVNGVRFDDTAAWVEDADGARRTREELRLGMTVEIDSGAVTQDATGPVASAARIRFESELAGPVSSVDRMGSSFMLLGQRVTVDSNTVFDERLTQGLDGLATDRLVEVYAEFDPAAQRYRATRVEPLAAGLPWRLRGLASQVDATAKTLRIGGTSYGYAGAAGLPADLAAGQFVRLRLTLASAPLRWVVQSFSPALRALPETEEVRLKGLISAFNSTGSFSVNGRALDATGAIFTDGSAGLAVGVRVEVEGTVRGGVLRAREVAIKTDEEEHDSGFQLSGHITSVDVAAGTFVLRGLTISTARPGLVYERGGPADLRGGRHVDVRGLLSADRLRIDATRITFD